MAYQRPPETLFDDAPIVRAEIQEIPREEVLSRRVEWKGFHNATVLQDNELELIQSYDKKPIETKIQKIQTYPREYADTFLSMLNQINSSAPLQYVLALIDEIFGFDSNFPAAFFETGRDPIPILKIMLSNQDGFVQTYGAKTLGLLLVRGYNRVGSAPEHARDLLTWCSNNLRESDLNIVRALTTLQVLVRREELRVMWRDFEDGINALLILLRHSEYQIVYQALYVLWLMSYSNEIANKVFTTNLIAKVVEAVKNVQKEKVTRIGIALLRNLRNHGPDNENNVQMLDAGFIRVLDNIRLRNWKDQEMEKNLEELNESLQAVLQEMSSWERYRSEILSGNLEWSPVHRSEKFWKENATRFEENEFEILGSLVYMVQNSKNPLILSVCCHDIGEFVRFHPRGRAVASSLGVKQAIMALMENQDPDVQKYALLCTQKLLVVNWDQMPRFR